MKMYQISEDDLETLETACPGLYDAIGPEALNRQDVQEHCQMVKRILSDVRWRYGPHKNVERIDA